MSRLLRSLSAAAFCFFVSTSLVSPACLLAGFELKIDSSSLKYNHESARYELNVLFGTNDIGPTPAKILTLGVTLSFTQPVDGITFAGVKNPTTSPLFPAIRTPFIQPPSAINWSASIRNNLNSGVTVVPGANPVAFTLEIAYERNDTTNSDIVFGGAFYVVDEVPLTFSKFDGTIGGLDFDPVPEPHAGLLCALALGAVSLRKRLGRSHLRAKID